MSDCSKRLMKSKLGPSGRCEFIDKQDCDKDWKAMWLNEYGVCIDKIKWPEFQIKKDRFNQKSKSQGGSDFKTAIGILRDGVRNVGNVSVLNTESSLVDENRPTIFNPRDLGLNGGRAKKASPKKASSKKAASPKKASPKKKASVKK